MNKYEEQAQEFLARTNTKLYIDKAVPQTSPLWATKGEKHGIDYAVRLKNDKHCFDFHFWGSIADAEKIAHGEGHGTKPTAYDILACLDVIGDVTFEEFADNFGYGVDSILALKTFEAVKEQDKNLRKLFSESELEALTEIN